MKTTEKLEKHSIGLEDCLYQEENHYFKKASIGLEDCPYQEENHYFEKASVGSTQENFIQEDTQMSFIIMMANKNGIAVSTDSKSTNIDNTNQYYEEGNRLAKKKFKTTDLVVATCGVNRVKVGHISTKLESVFPKMLNPLHSRDEFVSMLEREFAKIVIVPNAVYSFMIGERYENSYRISYVSYRGDGAVTIETNPIHKDHSVRVAGNLTFAPRNFNIREDWTLEQMKTIAKKTTEYVISIGESFTQNGYYSVGGPVQLETFV